MLNDNTFLEKSFGEVEAKFLEKIPHRWDWIYAESIADGGKAAWRTINGRVQKFAKNNGLPLKLTDEKLLELWRSPFHVVGVGFGKVTEYLMLDIDKDSPYHPSQGEQLKEIQGELEEIGLVRSLAVQSSYSGGIHLYYPLAEAVKSYPLARTVTDYLTSAGYEVANGKLEVFPNKKALGDKNDPKTWTQYQRHRLPLQQGSLILDRYFEPCGESLGEFMRRWEICASCQDHELLKESLKLKEVTFRGKGKGLEPMRADYQELLAKGFTGDAQTNDILLKLGRLTRILERLGGVALRDRLVTLVKNLPGYEKYCGHRRDLRQRCQDIARWAEKKFSIPKKLITPSEPLPPPGKNNLDKKLDALQRIQGALGQIKGEKFAYKTDFLKRIVAIARCSMSTLVKYWKKLLEPIFCKQHNLSAQDNPKDFEKRPTLSSHQNSAHTEGRKAEAQIVDNSLLDKGSSQPQTITHGRDEQNFHHQAIAQTSDGDHQTLVEKESPIQSLIGKLRNLYDLSEEMFKEACCEQSSSIYRVEKRKIPRWLSEFFLHRPYWYLYDTPPPQGKLTQGWVLANRPPHGTPPEKLVLVEVDVLVPK